MIFQISQFDIYNIRTRSIILFFLPHVHIEDGLQLACQDHRSCHLVIFIEERVGYERYCWVVCHALQAPTNESHDDTVIVEVLIVFGLPCLASAHHYKVTQGIFLDGYSKFDAELGLLVGNLGIKDNYFTSHVLS